MKSNKIKIIHNISLRGFFVALSKLIAFVTIPVITRALGPSVYGEYSFLIALSSYSTLPGNWGFLAKGIREIAATKNNEERSVVVSSIISTRILLSLIGLISFLLFAFLFEDIRFVSLLFIALLHHAIMTTFIDFYFYGNKNVWIPSIAHFIGQLIYAGFVLILIKTPEDLKDLLLLMVLMVSIESGILLWVSKEEIKVKVKLSISTTWRQFKENFKLGAGLKIGIIQQSYPLILIPVFLSNEVLGNYSATYKFYNVASVIMQMVVLSTAPYIIRSINIEETKRNSYIRTYLTLAVLFGLCMAIFVLIFADEITKVFFGSQYILGSSYLKWFSIAVLLITPLSIAIASLMNYYSMDNSFMIGGFIQTGLILILVPVSLFFKSVPFMIVCIGFSILFNILFYTYTLNSKFKFL